MNRIGSLYLSKNNLELAKQQFEQALQINLKLLGRWHPDVAQIYSNLALVNTNDEALSMSLCDSAMAAISYSSREPVSLRRFPPQSCYWMFSKTKGSYCKRSMKNQNRRNGFWMLI
ncbi:MAG: tetratricopeptide repeat protein [Saprospiraceae bacterium]|nr:tetratricopeptide repeat protein [Saprospiraceae bacterium]